MNRRKFVLSWGRKIFFGMSWPLTSLIGLLYLKSYIIPQGAADFIYFITTFIGHYGLLNAAVYFLLYAPIVLLMPSYYVSRFWSLFLILLLNLLVLVDATIFSSYQYHAYSFIFKLLVEGGLKYLPDRSTLTILVPCGVIFISVVLWIRGEIIWRSMQRRFSNPVSNWYLLLILVCLLIGQGLFYNGIVQTRLSSVFPLNYNLQSENAAVSSFSKYYYPTSSIECSKKEHKNFIFFVVKNWSSSDFNEVSMPHVWAMKKHAQVFNSHYPAAFDTKGGEFVFKYSVSGNYTDLAQKKEPVFEKELQKRNYEISKFENTESLKNWMINRAGDEIQPFYVYVTLNGSVGEVDKSIQDSINLLQKENLLSGTFIVMIGAFGGNEMTPTPLLMMTTEREDIEFRHITSHYDVIPTIMDRELGCKKAYQYASIGKSLYEEGQDWLFVAEGQNFKIIDFKSSSTTKFENHTLIDGPLNGNQGEVRRKLVFEGLKLRSKFSKPR